MSVSGEVQRARSLAIRPGSVPPGSTWNWRSDPIYRKIQTDTAVACRLCICRRFSLVRWRIVLVFAGIRIDIRQPEIQVNEVTNCLPTIALLMC